MTGRRRAGALLALAGLVLTGCSGAGERLRPAPPGAQPGGTVTVATTRPGSVDPGNAYEPVSDLLARTLCDTLIEVDPQTGELRPGLLESWLVSDGGRRLVVRLRKQARFSDGSPVTADDLSFSLSRVASADFAGATAGLLEPVVGYPEVHGDAPTDSDSDRRRLSGVRLLDAQSLEISLREPRADFVRVLTSPVTTPVPRLAASRDPLAFGRRPVCSGPYRLAAPVPPDATSIRLERVPGYRGAGQALTRGGAGYADAVVFRITADTAAAAALQRSGGADLAAAEPADRAVQAVPGPALDYLGLPTTSSPLFDKPQVRRALALALDRTRLVAAVFPRTRVPATGFLPPTARPVYDPRGCPDLPAAGDPAQARSLLAEVGVSLRGVRVPLVVNDDGRNVALAAEVARQWRAGLGLVATVQRVPFAELVRRGTAAQGLDAPFRFSWATPFPDPDGMLYPLFSTERIGRDNFSRYSSPAFDRLMVRQARTAVDAADRRLDYLAAAQQLCRDLPMVPLTVTLSRWLVSPRLGSAAGGFLDRSTGLPLLREIYRR